MPTQAACAGSRASGLRRLAPAAAAGSFVIESQSVSERVHGLVGSSPASVAVLAAVLCAVLTREEPPVPPDAAVAIEKRADYVKVCVVSFLLCLFSGMVNVVGFCEMGFLVAHQSGNTCHMGRLGLAGGSFALLVLCYAIGAAVPGYCKSNGDAPIHGTYCPAMLAAGVATLVGVWLYGASKGEASLVVLALWSYGQGIQNGVTSKFSSLPLLTTHHTGSITDAGSAFGLWLRSVVRGEAAPPLWRAGLLVLCIVGYAAGAYAARWGTEWYGISAGLPPAFAMALVGLGRGGSMSKRSA